METALDQFPIVFAYYAAPSMPCGQSSLTAGGCSISVSSAALRAIRAFERDGRLPQSTQRVLERIDAAERQATELGVLVRALGRRDVYVRRPSVADADGT